MNIYVSNLSFNVQDEDLREFFTEYGEVSSAKVITDKFTGKSRGFGFVEMPDNEAAQKAIAELDNGTVEGRTIRVMEAKPKEDKPARSGGFRGGNGGGGYNGGGGGYNKNRY
jgi:RNA recognition motif-containing protein